VHDPDEFAAAVEEGEKSRAIGDIVWPSSVALSERLVRGFGSMIEGRSVVEVGCGMGLTGLTAARLGAAQVLATDCDPRVLDLVKASAELNGFQERFSTAVVDWKDPSGWPAAGTADLILGADVLYHGHGHLPLAQLLKHLLAHGGANGDAGPRFALLMEPVHEERITATDGQAFAVVAEGEGLDVHVTSVEGPRAMQQIIVTAPAQ